MDIYLHLLKNVKEDIKKLGKQQNNLAKNIGISSENLSYCLANQVRFKFTIFEKLLKEIYEDQYSIYEDHLIQFIESTPRLENIRECLEWCCNHCELELFEVALERAIKDKKMKETAEIYKLINDRRSGGDIIRIFDHVEDFRIRTKSKENITLLSLLSLNILEDLNKFSAISLYARQAKRNIEALKSGYIKDSYYVRLKEIEL